MAKLKTTENNNDVKDFLRQIADPERQRDAFAIMEIMQKQSGFPAKMWGPAIVGFGSYHYKYKSGHEGDAPLVGFSPRKNAFAIYLSTQFAERKKLLAAFGKHSTSKVCIYVKKLADINESIFEEMVQRSVKYSMETKSAC